MGRLQTETITIRVTPEEKHSMQGKMYEAVAPSMREFILRMCMDGKVKKRVIEILIDDSSGFLTDEECEKWKEHRKERTELESERKRQEQQLLDTWFDQEEYIKGSWWKRLWLRLVYAIKDTHGEGRLPDFVAKDIARWLLPSIVAYFESEEGKKAFAEWMEKKNVLQNERFATQSKKDGE